MDELEVLWPREVELRGIKREESKGGVGGREGSVTCEREWGDFETTHGGGGSETKTWGGGDSETKHGGVIRKQKKGGLILRRKTCEMIESVWMCVTTIETELTHRRSARG